MSIELRNLVIIVDADLVKLGGRPRSTARFSEGNGHHRSLRPGHASKGVSREPRRAAYLLGKKARRCRAIEVGPGPEAVWVQPAEANFTLAEVTRRQEKSEAVVRDSAAVLRTHSTEEGGEPQGSREGRPGYPPEGRGEQMDGVTR